MIELRKADSVSAALSSIAETNVTSAHFSIVMTNWSGVPVLHIGALHFNPEAK